jgi:hypothetical protein
MRDPDEGVAADGTIVTGVRRERVPGVFEPVLAAVCDAVGTGVGVYLYGSVATGQAVVGRSDVDLVTVGLDPAAAAELGAALSRRFAGVCREVAIGAAGPGFLDGDDDRAYGDRAFLRHYCVHLSGPNPAAALPAYPADARAARGFNGDIARVATGWRKALAAGADPAVLGRRLARKTLLAAAGLVSVHDDTWTTDRTRAATRGDTLLPDLSPSLTTLLTWTDTDTPPTATAVTQALTQSNGAVARVTTAFATKVGLWRETS